MADVLGSQLRAKYTVVPDGQATIRQTVSRPLVLRPRTVSFWAGRN